jgi:hypothetical protein
MLADQIVRADFAARSLPRSASIREFAAREFPNEDCRWVASALSGAPRKVRTPGRWSRLLRSFGIRRKAEQPEVDPALEPTATA